jgi:hypothetical protein
VEEEIIVNSTLVYAKKFIEPSKEHGKCKVYYVGKNHNDKQAIVTALSSHKRVVVELEGNGGASKHRGEQLVINGVEKPGGGAVTFQEVKDSSGKIKHLVTVHENKVRYFFLQTKDFMKTWNSFK